MTNSHSVPGSYYRQLATQNPSDPAQNPRPTEDPGTTLTATIETMDNDRAFALEPGTGLPLA